jgi:hypothetical protein
MDRMDETDAMDTTNSQAEARCRRRGQFHHALRYDRSGRFATEAVYSGTREVP